MKRFRTVTIKEAIDDLVSHNRMTPMLDEARVATAWREVAGYFAQAPEKISFSRKCLFLKIPSPSVRNEILMRRSEFVRLLNEHLGSEMIETIVFQ